MTEVHVLYIEIMMGSPPPNFVLLNSKKHFRPCESTAEKALM